MPVDEKVFDEKTRNSFKAAAEGEKNTKKQKIKHA